MTFNRTSSVCSLAGRISRLYNLADEIKCNYLRMSLCGLCGPRWDPIRFRDFLATVFGNLHYHYYWINSISYTTPLSSSDQSARCTCTDAAAAREQSDLRSKAIHFFFFWTKFNNVSPGRTQSPSLFVYIVNAHTCKRYTLTHAHTHTFGDRTPTEPVFYVFFAGSRAPRCSSRFAIYVLQVHTHNTRMYTPR